MNNNIALKHPTLRIGQGIFGLSEQEKDNLCLTNNELTLIKPYYTTEQIKRYVVYPRNRFWLIYTTSSFKNPDSMDSYPNIKRHLNLFRDVITSDNKPYGLHRARNEAFFLGEKIICQRKCVGAPSFSYADFPTYVSATFYVIKTERFNLKFLTGLLNSKLIAYWLRHKGKMQGSNFQIDKDPLLQIPIKSAKEIDKMFRAKGFEPRGPNPIKGEGGYVNPKTSRSYHIDEANRFGEPPHVDVNRPRGYYGPLKKRKFDMEKK